MQLLDILAALVQDRDLLGGEELVIYDVIILMEIVVGLR